MTTPSQRKGDTYERDAVNYLRMHLGAQVARQRTSPTGDRGDIAGILGWTLELKCYTDTLRAIADGIHDLNIEQANAATPYGAVIVKRRGMPVEDSLFIMRLEAAVPVMRELGWPA